jgi:hypothetical protein
VKRAGLDHRLEAGRLDGAREDRPRPLEAAPEGPLVGVAEHDRDAGRGDDGGDLGRPSCPRQRLR